jgi:tight adherence protein C
MMKAAGPIAWVVIVFAACVVTYQSHAARGLLPLMPRQRNSIVPYIYAVVGAWLRWTGGYARLISCMPQLVRFCLIIHGRQETPDPTFVWASRAFAFSLGSFVSAVMALLAEADSAIVAILSALVVILPLLIYRDLQQKVRHRQESFITELPSFMHKLSLLMSAGESMQRSWVRASAVTGDKCHHPLYIELSRTNNELAQSVPFPKALEDLHRRCGVSELSTLVTTVLMNYRRGGEAFAMVLQDTSRVLMERKYALIRTKGEEASTRLLFPMLLMLIAVMVIVASPAVMMMN